MNEKEKLEKFFTQFPGIGPRQAKRFVSFLLFKDIIYVKNLTDTMLNLKQNIKRCPKCNTFFSIKNNYNVCNICMDPRRDKKKILILEKNADLEIFEKASIWKGTYFLIGKNLKINDENPEKSISLSPLMNRLKTDNVEEIIFGLSINPEGDITKDFIKNYLEEQNLLKNIKINELARGLSLGSEIDHSDPITLKSAFYNRK